jgi:hypothetical protein
MIAIAYNTAVPQYPATRASVQSQHPIPKPVGNQSSFMESHHIITIDILIAAMRRLDSFAMYAPDWDDAGAATIAADTIMRAKRLVRDIFANISHSEGEPYYIGPIPNGGIQTEWRGDADSIEVEIRPDGGFDYLLVRGYASQPNIVHRRDVPSDEIVRLVSEILDTQRP